MRPDLVPESLTVRQFDQAITIHSFGWPSVDAYYAGEREGWGAWRLSLLCILLLLSSQSFSVQISFDLVI